MREFLLLISLTSSGRKGTKQYVKYNVISAWMEELTIQLRHHKVLL